MSKERGIPCNGAMVQAILAGRKTQMRRIVKPQPPDHAIEVFDWRAPDIAESAKANEGCYYRVRDGLRFHCKCPYGTIGDRLWVRETWGKDPHSNIRGHKEILYRATDRIDPDYPVAWRSSIHMPRWASRLTLEITGVRVERLNAISEEDAVSEGTDFGVNALGRRFVPPIDRTRLSTYRPCREGFQKLWESINGEGSWAANPWVWVVSVKTYP